MRVPLGREHTLLLLPETLGAERITARDAFLAELSDQDRKLRLGTTEAVSDEALLAFLRAQVRSFSPAQVARLEKAAARVAELAEARGVLALVPREVEIVLTTGDEEGTREFDLSYTRASVIYLNARALETFPKQLLAHELMHVICAAHPQLREALYASIGFVPREGIRLSPELEARRVTGPEVPRARHAIVVRHEGAEKHALPLTLARTSANVEGSFLEQIEDAWVLLDAEGVATTLVAPDALEGLSAQIGFNTGYLAGPEEILADNFSLLLFAPDKARSPEVLERIRALLVSAASSARADQAHDEVGR